LHRMAHLHRATPVAGAEASLFPTLREWLHKAPRRFTKAAQQRVFDAQLSFSEIAAAVEELEETLLPLR